MEGHTSTVISEFENAAVAKLGVSASGCTLLDVGCGTCQGLRDTGADIAVGVDIRPETFTPSPGDIPRVAGDVRALPFSSLTFDIVWCRLTLGHVREMEMAYAELSRVCCMGGVVIVSDLSTERGTTHELEPFTHTIERQAVAAYDAGLRLEKRQDVVVDSGVSVRALLWRKNST